MEIARRVFYLESHHLTNQCFSSKISREISQHRYYEHIFEVSLDRLRLDVDLPVWFSQPHQLSLQGNVHIVSTFEYQLGLLFASVFDNCHLDHPEPFFIHQFFHTLQKRHKGFLHKFDV